jgi:predicted CoA-binding protein
MAGMPIEDEDTLRELLEHTRVAVVGASATLEKAAHIVPAYLQRHGYETIPVNPNVDELFDRPAYDSLSEVDEDVDIVEVFRPSEEVSGIVDEAVAREDVKAIWMQLDIQNDAAAERAEAAGLSVVQDHCMKVQHGLLIRNPME